MSQSLTRMVSDKLHIIDRATYEEIHQQNQNGAAAAAVTAASKQIRNSKYRKTHAVGYSILQFQCVKQKPIKTKCRRVCRKATVATVAQKPGRRRHGKTREGGWPKKRSRLKKSILRYRQQKREQRQRCEVLEMEKANEKHKMATNPVLQAKKQEGKPLHSRRFRAYCDNCTTPALAELAERLLRELNRFQRRAYNKNAIKTRAHPRFVVGMRELECQLRIEKVKLAIIAPDCEECAGEDGLDEKINALKTGCTEQQTPYVFTLSRRQLGYALYKKSPVSCVGVLDYDGARDIFMQLLAALDEARNAYNLQVKLRQDLEVS